MWLAGLSGMSLASTNWPPDLVRWKVADRTVDIVVRIMRRALIAVLLAAMAQLGLAQIPPDGPESLLDRIVPSGRWMANVEGNFWIFDLVVDAPLSGTVRIGGTPVAISNVRQGKDVSFEIREPGKQQPSLVTMRIVDGQIAFGVEAPGEERRKFNASRNRKVIELRGMKIEIGPSEGVENLDAALKTLEQEITVVDDTITNPEVRAFLKSVPVVLVPIGSNGAFTSDGGFLAPSGIVMAPRVYETGPFLRLLHEMMHAYHYWKLAESMQNPEILAMFQEARASGRFSADSYMLRNAGEYFAMMTSTYLNGTAGREPFTREAIKQKQPSMYAWMEKEFGPK
jgi:hypothetical protein